MKPMLNHRSSSSAVACESDILVFRGFDISNITTLNTCEKFISSSDGWEAIADMSAERYAALAVHIPGYGEVVVGGFDGYTNLNTVELLQIGTSVTGNDRKWCTLASMLYPRSFPALELFEAIVYAAGDFESSISDQTTEMFSLYGDEDGGRKCLLIYNAYFANDY